MSVFAATRVAGTATAVDTAGALPATFAQRIGATLIDAVWIVPRLALMFVALAVVLAPFAGTPSAPNPGRDAAMGLAVMLGLVLAVAVILGRQESSAARGTVGQVVAGCRLERADGAPVSTMRAAVRRALAILFWPVMFFIPFSMTRQGVYDAVTGCRLVRLRPSCLPARLALIEYFGERFWPVALSLTIGAMTVPIGVGVLILIVWLPRAWEFRQALKRLFREIHSPSAAADHASEPIAAHTQEARLT